MAELLSFCGFQRFQTGMEKQKSNIRRVKDAVRADVHNLG